MIWIATVCLILVTLLFISAPLYRSKITPQTETSEAASYLAEIEKLEAEIEAGKVTETAMSKTLLAKKTELERRVLALKAKVPEPTQKPSFLLSGVLSAIILLSVLGLYMTLGSPDFAHNKSGNHIKTSDMRQPGLENGLTDDLIERLAATLDKNPNALEGWMLYARSLMSLERFDEAFIAYDEALKLSGQDQTIKTELERARAFAKSRLSGPSQSDIEAAENMSADDRQQMILGMVQGLAQKLKDNPDDPAGWVRLLRSRKVLGQSEQAKADIVTMRLVFSKDPKTIEIILEESGWASSK